MISVKYEPGKSALEALREAAAEEFGVTVRLLGPCNDPGCVTLMEGLRATVDQPKYRTGAALMAMPESRAAWEAEHRTARKRAWRAERLGYMFQSIDHTRPLFSQDIHAINTSLDKRQGRPMSDGYLEYREQSAMPEYPCDRHAIRCYGIVHDGTLVSYMTLYRVNELALVSMILGHGDHLANDIMYLLFAGMVERQADLGGWIYYNRWDSGTEGLRFYKQRVGFAEMDVRWEL